MEVSWATIIGFGGSEVQREDTGFGRGGGSPALLGIE
jgi:hypothetical protein